MENNNASLQLTNRKKESKYPNLYLNKIAFLKQYYGISHKEYEDNLNNIENIKNDIKAYEKEFNLALIKGFLKKKKNSLNEHFLNIDQYKDDIKSVIILYENNIKKSNYDIMSIYNKIVLLKDKKLDNFFRKHNLYK